MDSASLLNLHLMHDFRRNSAANTGLIGFDSICLLAITLEDHNIGLLQLLRAPGGALPNVQDVIQVTDSPLLLGNHDDTYKHAEEHHGMVEGMFWNDINEFFEGGLSQKGFGEQYPDLAGDSNG